MIYILLNFNKTKYVKCFVFRQPAWRPACFFTNSFRNLCSQSNTLYQPTICQQYNVSKYEIMPIFDERFLENWYLKNISYNSWYFYAESNAAQLLPSPITQEMVSALALSGCHIHIDCHKPMTGHKMFSWWKAYIFLMDTVIALILFFGIKKWVTWDSALK